MTTTATTNLRHDHHRGPQRPRGFAVRAASASAAALAVVTVLFLAAPSVTVAAMGASGSAGELVTLPDVLMATGVGSLGAVALAALLRRFNRRPRTTFVVLSAVALTLYGLLAAMAAETVSSAIWLNVLHLGVATPLLAGLLPCLPRRKPSSPAQDLPPGAGNTLEP